MLKRVRTTMCCVLICLSHPIVAAQDASSTKNAPPPGEASSNGPPKGEAADSKASESGAERVEKLANLSFAEREGAYGMCDVYLPSGRADGALSPVVLLVHGGAWLSGNKWTMERHALKLAQKGFAAVSVNYRLAPKHKFPAQVDDVRDALVWIHNHAEDHAFDLNRLGVYGYSAGGHLVSLVAMLADEPWETVQATTAWPQDDRRWKELPDIKAICAGGPPTDFQTLPENNTTLAYFLGGSRAEKPKVYAAASPIRHVSKSDPPVLLVHGDADLLVPIASSKQLKQRLTESEVEVSLTIIEKCGHFFTFINPQLTTVMLEFFEERLAAKND